jgi:hypothetical protein
MFDEVVRSKVGVTVKTAALTNLTEAKAERKHTAERITIIDSNAGLYLP